MCCEYSFIDSSKQAYIELLGISSCKTGWPNLRAVHLVTETISDWNVTSPSYVPYGVCPEPDVNDDGSVYLYYNFGIIFLVYKYYDYIKQKGETNVSPFYTVVYRFRLNPKI